MKPRSIRCMKFFLTFFNIICILFGLVLMAVCVMNMRGHKSRPEQSALSRGVLSFLLTLGLCLVVTAVLGCIGALREHVRILYVHASFFIFLVSVEVVVGVGGAVLSAWVGGGNELRGQFFRNITIDDEATSHYTFWDQLQAENQCCGIDGPQDYAILHREIPTSCCSRAYPLRDGGARRQIHATCLSEKTYYAVGCEEALRKKKAFKGNIFITTGVIFALLEMMSLLWARMTHSARCDFRCTRPKALLNPVWDDERDYMHILCIVLALWMARTIRVERRKLQQNLQAHFES